MSNSVFRPFSKLLIIYKPFLREEYCRDCKYFSITCVSLGQVVSSRNKFSDYIFNTIILVKSKNHPNLIQNGFYLRVKEYESRIG